MDRVNVVIAGGGVIGSALAFALSRRGVGDILVVDLDLAGIYASSELNAGGARATWWQRVNIASCKRTLDFFREHEDEFGFRECGYLWLYDREDAFERARAHRTLQNEYALGVEILSPEEVGKRFPILDRNLDELVGATFSPRDGLVNPNTVRHHYRREAEARGVRFANRHYISGVRSERVRGESGVRKVTALDVLEIEPGDPADDSGVLREILTTHRIPHRRIVAEHRVEAELVVNCLGAWSPIFSAKIGVSDVTEPVRRQICLIDVHREDLAPGVELEPLGMIVDASDLYFHPEGPHVLAGFSIPEEAPGFDFSYDGRDYFENYVWPRLAYRASSFERCGHVRGWSGLYAVTPDCSGIAGPVSGFANLYEAHSFTGRGVMQSLGIAEGLAEHVRSGRYAELDLSPLSRERFVDRERWIPEDLHI